VPLDAMENRVLTAVLARLATIGVSGGASAWLTVPTVREGTPADVVDPLTKPLVMLESSRTDPDQTNINVSEHGARVTNSVWLVAKDMRTVNKLKADVLRALFAGEGALTVALRQPVYPGEFVVRSDMRSVGRVVGELLIFVDVILTHTDP